MSTSVDSTGAATSTAAAPASSTRLLGWALALVAVLAVIGLTGSMLLWQKLGNIQQALAQQSQDAGRQAIEARALARQASELAQESAARLAVQETRLSEVALQRSQLEELMQSLSRSRDENLVVDIEANVRLAQQQAQLTGSMQPLVASIKSAQQRIERAAQPRLAPVQRALALDLERLSSASVTDTAGLLARLDELLRQVDELPLKNAVAQAAATRRLAASARPTAASGAAAGETVDLPAWMAPLQRGWDAVKDEMRGLVRVRRIDQPEAILISPDQAFFLRENLKLMLLNARLGILARQLDAARSDLLTASAALNKYFDPAARRTQTAATAMQQIQAHLNTVETPRLDETLSALATAAAGR
ncbi:MAG: uroporphyrinogen-III C-methyltransferase [Simplicispira suum]|uniref:uroporphyrinogen-III C-methyltransferase n=1 Tax=Simplicispira suum TaxID=2109915 RepID=UPI001C6C8F51|nr:uroporphyrinogen-III C-methyltransferase [Simplicispira suum]MBW7834916.1 uroporphyrinogen-III C-methyltransferase [Simplicispira suum]